MKKTLLFFMLLAGCIFSAQSQDNIYLLDEEVIIEAKILEVNEEEIKYKKFDYLDGPLFIVKKSELSKIEFQNGDVKHLNAAREYQKSTSLLPSSRLYVQYHDVEDKNNVDSDDAQTMAGNILRNLTRCEVVDNPEDSDFILNLKVTRFMVTNRRAQITIEHKLSGETVYESKWHKGSPNEFNGFSGTRRSITKIVRRSLLKEYPEISRK